MGFLNKFRDWIVCPDCKGLVCDRCSDSGNPGYILIPLSD